MEDNSYSFTNIIGNENNQANTDDVYEEGAEDAYDDCLCLGEGLIGALEAGC